MYTYIDIHNIYIFIYVYHIQYSHIKENYIVCTENIRRPASVVVVRRPSSSVVARRPSSVKYHLFIRGGCTRF